MSNPSSLESRLAGSLPKDVKIRVYHVSTPPTSSPPILAAPPGQDEEYTVCESHFLGVTSESGLSSDSTFVYAIEILVFTTTNLTTIFVSKADSSGFTSRLALPPKSPSIVKTITQTFLDFLLASRLDHSRVVLSLFARSQNQYLFPGSVENVEKHVLDDRHLIKWWCKVLDDVWRPYDQPVSGHGKRHNVAAHVVVPGCDQGETKAFFPVSSKRDSQANPKWSNTFPLQFIAGVDTLPLRCSIPRLPDDPKSRFLDDLDGDFIGPEGQWRNVKSLSQFWEMMSFRQECHAGRLVGFIWITFSTSNSESSPSHNNTGLPSALEDPVTALLPTPAQSFSETTLQSRDATNVELEKAHESIPDSPPPSSPLPQEDAIELRNDLVVDNASGPEDEIRPVALTTNGETQRGELGRIVSYSTSGEVVLNPDSYEDLMDFLLQLDFAGLDTAVQSTKHWIEKVMAFGAVTTFGQLVEGRKPLLEASLASEESAPQPVNTLLGIRKKRKPEGEPAPSAEPKITTLSSSMIRKKPKVEKSA